MDLTQIIFLAVLQALPPFDSRKSVFRTWSYRIAANKVIGAHRRFRPDLVSLEDIETAGLSDFAAQFHNRALLEQIEAHVSALDPQIQIEKSSGSVRPECET